MAENKIGKDDIFSRESLGTIKEVQSELLSTLEIMKLLADSGVKLQESLKKPQGLEDTAKATEKVVQNNNRLVETAKQLEAQQNKLIAAQARETASRTQTNQEILRTNQITAENNKIAKLQAVLADENAGKLEKLHAAQGLLRIQKLKLKETDENYVETIAKLNEEMDKNQAEIAETHNAEQKRTAGIGQYKEQMQALIGQYKEQAGELFTSFKNGELGAKGLAKGVLELGKQMIVSIVTNPILLTLGLITGAMLALNKAFAKTDSGGTALAAKFEQIKAIIDVIRLGVSSLTKGIVALFSGDSQKAAEEFGNAQKINAERLREAAKAAKEYTYALDSIEDSENNYISRSAEMKNQISKLEFTAADRTLSTEERKKALEEALKLGAEEVAQRKKFAEDRLNAEVDYLAKKNGLTRQEVLAFIKMTDEEQANASKAMKAARDNNEDKFAEIEQFYADAINADTTYFEENKRNASKLSGFEKELADERKKAIDEANAKRQEAEEKAAERAKKRQELNEKIAENEKKTSRLIIETEEEQDKVLREMENQFKEDLNKTLDDNSKAHSDSVKDALAAYDAYYKEQSALLLENKGLFSNDKDERLTAEEELAARTLELQRELLQEKINSGLLEKDELTDAKMALFDVNKQIHDQEMGNLEDESEKRKAITAQSIELAGQAFDVIGQLQDAAMSRLEARHERELASTEEGSEARIKAEAKYDVEKRKLQRKQAVLEKAQGLFNVGVNTAQAIMSALVEFPGPAGLVFSAIFGAMGAAQAAAILAKPLPAFKDGGIVGSDTWARVSEEGAELVRLPSGGTMLTPENESIMRLPRGAEVIPHDETMRLLAREAYVSANIEMGETNRILNKIHDKPSETVVNGVRYVNKKGLKGVYY